MKIDGVLDDFPPFLSDMATSISFQRQFFGVLWPLLIDILIYFTVWYPDPTKEVGTGCRGRDQQAMRSISRTNLNFPG